MHVGLSPWRASSHSDSPPSFYGGTLGSFILCEVYFQYGGEGSSIASSMMNDSKIFFGKYGFLLFLVFSYVNEQLFSPTNAFEALPSRFDLVLVSAGAVHSWTDPRCLTSWYLL